MKIDRLMEDYVFEKQIASRSEYDWIITALQGMASAYTNKRLEQTLAKTQSIDPAKSNAVSVDFGVATEDAKIDRHKKHEASQSF